MQGLKNYLAMLKETIAIVDAGIKGGKTLDQMQKEKVLGKSMTCRLGRSGNDRAVSHDAVQSIVSGKKVSVRVSAGERLIFVQFTI